MNTTSKHHVCDLLIHYPLYLLSTVYVGSHNTVFTGSEEVGQGHVTRLPDYGVIVLLSFGKVFFSIHKLYEMHIVGIRLWSAFRKVSQPVQTLGSCGTTVVPIVTNIS